MDVVSPIQVDPRASAARDDAISPSSSRYSPLSPQTPAGIPGFYSSSTGNAFIHQGQNSHEMLNLGEKAPVPESTPAITQGTGPGNVPGKTPGLAPGTAAVSGGDGLGISPQLSDAQSTRSSPPDTPRAFHKPIQKQGSTSSSASSSPPSSAALNGSFDVSAQTDSNSNSNSKASKEDPDAIWRPSQPKPTSSRSKEAGAGSGNTHLTPPMLTINEVPGLAAGSAPRDSSNTDDEDFDDEAFYKKFAEPPSRCSSDQDIHQSRKNWLSITIYILSLYSTAASGLWLVVAILQPRWGHQISTRQGLLPSTSTVLTALIAKTIEMSFVTVFVAFLGQVLTRRAFIRKAQGMTVAEMTMRNWVFQPGSLITHFETLPSSAMTILGVLSLTATFAASFYTTASDAMVAPKLKFGNWESHELQGRVRASYANAQYVREHCPSVISVEDDIHAEESCMNVQFSGMSYRNLLNFMTTWTELGGNHTTVGDGLKHRPAGNTLLYDNTTLTSAWIETEHGDVAAAWDEYERIVNNVTMAIPHPGVYGAATLEQNGILQPEDLAGVGSYALRAGVVSPAINVMCVNADEDDLAPLIYTKWPRAKTKKTGVGRQRIGVDSWVDHVPASVDDDGKDNWLNRTKLDDIFQWGPDYERRPPVFQLYPADYNILTNGTVNGSDSIYILGKAPDFPDYTLCQLRSWVSPNCSTHFNISGTGGASMNAHCEDPDDEDSYLRSFPRDQGWGLPSLDFKWLADQWRLSMDLNGGALNVNASNARLLTQLTLREPALPTNQPSMAEAIAVYAGALLMISAIDTPWRHYWEFDTPQLEGSGKMLPFNASIITQQYTSGHTENWQKIFYVVLVIVFVINLCCISYFVVRSGMVTDFTEPQNLFSLAVNSPPSTRLNGACGGGPEKRHLVVPWRVAYAPSANHYFFEETFDAGGGREGKAPEAVSTSRDYGQVQASSYKRLSSSKSWL